MFKKLINFIKNRRYNLFYYYRCLNKKIEEYGILLCSSYGKDINGNIFYILKELNKKEYSKYKKYVVVNKKYKLEFMNKLSFYHISSYDLVIIDSWKYMKLLARCKYLFNDTSFSSYFVKRKGQVYFNTWHGTPFKTMGRRDKDGLINIGNIQKNFMSCDYLLYPNEYMKEVMLRDYMIYGLLDNNIVMSGYPRNEIFFDKNRSYEIKSELNIQDKQIIMYMPTWRGSNSKDIDIENNVNKIVKYLKEIDNKLKDNQIMFVNFHPFLKDKIIIDGYKHIKSFNRMYETYDFLNIADILVTDYSSVFFDFAVTNKKIILFTYDEKEYFENRGTYFSIDELPFRKVYNVKDLIMEINISDKVNYSEFINLFCKYECKNASEKICRLVLNNKKKDIKIEKKVSDKNNILIFGGNLSKNGITSSLSSLLSSVDTKKKNYYLCYVPSHIKGNEDYIRNLDDNIKYIGFNSNFIGTFNETLFNVIERFNILPYSFLDRVFDVFYKREIKRCFGYSKFNSSIQFCGYGGYIIKLFSKFNNNKIIYAHSDMNKEASTRKNQNIKLLKYYYDKYDRVAIVNETIYESMNKLVSSNKLAVVNNLINYKEIIKLSKKDILFDEDTVCNKSFEYVLDVINNKYVKFINVGRFSEEKGQIRLIDAFDKVYKDNKNVYLFIVGGHGKEYDNIFNYVNTLSCHDNIILIKSMSNPFPVIKKCDCFVLSSFYEGFGLALAEADILGLYTFSTNISGPVKFLKDNNGNICENSMDGIYEYMIKYLNNELNKMNVDYEKYNEKALKEFYNIVER